MMGSGDDRDCMLPICAAFRNTSKCQELLLCVENRVTAT